MKKQLIPLLFIMTLGASALASCGANEILNDWSYTKDDMVNFMELQGEVKINDQATFAIGTGSPILTRKINTSDIKVFNMEKALKEMANDGNDGYLNYRIIKNNAVTVKDVETRDDCSGFTVTFNGQTGNHYGMLINKTATANGNYMFCSETEPQSLGSYTDAQLEFEEEYLSDRLTWESGPKFLNSVIMNGIYAYIGAATGSPTAFASGVINIWNSIFDQITPKKQEPTVQDVLDKLDVIEQKMDEMSITMNKNFDLVNKELVCIETKVDRSLLQASDAAITAFVTDYVEPIDDFTRNLGDYNDQSYKAFVNKEQEINIYLYKNEKDEWVAAAINEEDSTSQTLLKICVGDFPNSREFLRTHGNVVEKGFMDEFEKDLGNAIDNTTLPYGLDKETTIKYIKANIIEHFNKQYYQDNHQKALDINNMAINFAKRLSGRNGTTSVVTDYANRLTYMYNFGYEVKTAGTHVLSSLLDRVDKTLVLAAEACTYAEINNSQTSEEFDYARDAVQDTFAALKTVEDSYCYTSETVLNSGFYQAKFDTKYTNKGNHPNFKANLEFWKVTGGTSWQHALTNISKINFVEKSEHQKIIARMNMLRQSGATEETSYINYLVSAHAMDEDALKTFKAMNAAKWVSMDGNRIATNLTTRSLTDADKKYQFTVSGKGNDESNYFNDKWSGKYKSYRNADCWSGKIAESEYIDATTGESQSDHKVAAYATYTETHWYWSVDEFWSFIDNPSGNYMFILSHRA